MPSNVANVYRKVWNTPEARAAADSASNLYTSAAEKSGLKTCDRGAVTYGASGAADSISVATLRQCGKSFGAEVTKT